ncbi:OLC1v1013748C1 [Oldenlandia corymbosa var. corymbosa]|uniref:OLC1v1013748C1 n=1 Tax=Oldenlandia corymbosa var. corymbosa TaxID=529605 RepID=A0AAV1DZ43_OLDCO|nr:OLC1v1013748C1 [Oldenlandia corymbosa var. corymbosa]
MGSLFALVFLVTFLSASSLEFNLPSIGQPETGMINVTLDAYISNQGIKLTPEERRTAQAGKSGRATYLEPLHLWDKSSGLVTNFSTNFSFLILADSPDGFADGLTFFLTPVGSRILETNASYSGGGSLGLGNRTSTENVPLVAIEFDTWKNVWDVQDGPHVGIDINSFVSVTSIPWANNMTQDNVNTAWITYDSVAMNLTVSFTGVQNNLVSIDSLSYVIDLREYLPEWVTFGFSGATGRYFETHNIKSWGFYSSLPESMNLEPASSPSPEDAEPPPTPVVQERRIAGVNSGKLNKNIEIGMIASLVALIFLLALLGYEYWKKRTKEAKPAELELDITMDTEFEKGSGARKFSYSELTRATKSFSEDEKLGEGGFGSVYRGFLKDMNSFVAVKRVSRDSNQGLKEYASEVTIINRLRHRNLVQLIGWCHEKGNLLLVYEFMPNGSLDCHLFKDRTLLSWETRYKIALGLASALLYLHEEWEQCIVHRDIKSSNIMLDSSFNAKLGDFGLARLVDHEKTSQTMTLAGTLGYMAPECATTGKASKESDVYSFGIVALEIACGRKAVDFNAPANQGILVQWIWELYGKGELLEGADPKLGSDFVEEQMERLMTVGLCCAHPDSASRPSIRQVIHLLNSESHLPNLPPKMPIPTYASPAFAMYSPSFFHTRNDGTDDDSYALQSSNPSSNVASSSGLTASTKSAVSSASNPRI